MFLMRGLNSLHLCFLETVEICVQKFIKEFDLKSLNVCMISLQSRSKITYVFSSRHFYWSMYKLSFCLCSTYTKDLCVYLFNISISSFKASENSVFRLTRALRILINWDNLAMEWSGRGIIYFQQSQFFVIFGFFDLFSLYF